MADFGQGDFDQCVLLLLLLWWWCCGVGVGFTVSCHVWPDRPSPGPPKISLFLFPLPPQNSFFSSLSGGLLVEFWRCLKRRGAQMCTVGLSKHIPQASSLLDWITQMCQLGLRGGTSENRKISLFGSDGEGFPGREPPITRRKSSRPIAGESASSVGRPVAPVGPIRFGERVFVESAHAESVPSFLEKSVP